MPLNSSSSAKLDRKSLSENADGLSATGVLMA
jgi:hypothetical protein